MFLAVERPNNHYHVYQYVAILIHNPKVGKIGRLRWHVMNRWQHRVNLEMYVAHVIIVILIFIHIIRVPS